MLRLHQIMRGCNDVASLFGKGYNWLYGRLIHLVHCIFGGWYIWGLIYLVVDIFCGWCIWRLISLANVIFGGWIILLLIYLAVDIWAIFDRNSASSWSSSSLPWRGSFFKFTPQPGSIAHQPGGQRTFQHLPFGAFDHLTIWPNIFT